MPSYLGILIAIGLFAPGVVLLVLGLVGLRRRGDAIRKMLSVLSIVVGLLLVSILALATMTQREPWNALLIVAAGGVALGALGFWVMVLADCLLNETKEGNERIVWTLVVIFLPVIGAALYYFLRRPRRLARGSGG